MIRKFNVDDNMKGEILKNLATKATYLAVMHNAINHFLLINDEMMKIFNGEVEDDFKKDYEELRELNNEFMKKLAEFSDKYANKHEMSKYELAMYGLFLDVRLVLGDYLSAIVDIANSIENGAFAGFEVSFSSSDDEFVLKAKRENAESKYIR